ncbi:MAG TPA: hypothetical protein VHT26_07605 [Trebonia sp.]|jgi:hypothetical protein|nr:hypothetical protein [Trebonia sp.]
MTLTLPVTSWDTLATICFNRKVLMVGVEGASEVITIAQVATITAVYAGVNPADLGRDMSVIEHVASCVDDAHLAGRVLLHNVIAPLGITQYRPGTFDVAIFNPAAARSDTVGEDLEMIANYARDLAVICALDQPLWEEITAVTQPRGLMATGYDCLVVARPMPTEPIVRQD